MRRRIIPLVLVAAGLFSGVFFLSGFRATVRAALPDPHVTAGGSISFTTTFRNVRSSPVDPESAVSVTDDSGREYFRRAKDILSGCGIELAYLDQVSPDATREREKLRACVQELSGFTEPVIPLLLEGRLLALSEGISCPAGLGTPPGKPPRKTIVTESLFVLPKTPPGLYSVRLRADRYCDLTLPSEAVALPVSVE